MGGISAGGRIRDWSIVVQQKTGRSVQFEIVKTSLASPALLA